MTNVQVYSRALLPSEIEQLYAAPWDMYTPRARVFPATAITATGTGALLGGEASLVGDIPNQTAGRLTGPGAILVGSAEAFSLDAISADALRLYDSDGIEIVHLRAVGTIPGVRILLAAARNGPGVGMLRYLAGSLYWRAPGSSTFGTAVPATVDGEYLLTDGDDLFKFVRVQVYADYLQQRDGRVFLGDVYNNAIGHDDLTAAQALAGNVATWTITARNESASTIYNVSAWVDFAVTGIELSNDGIAWSGGVPLGVLAPAASATLYLRRTIGAAEPYDPAVMNAIHFSFGASA